MLPKRIIPKPFIGQNKNYGKYAVKKPLNHKILYEEDDK